MKKIKIFIFVIVAITALTNSAYGSQKWALVVGNGDYAEGRLENPLNDASDMTATLINKGFEVKLVLNGTLDQLEDEIRAFIDRLKGPGNIGLFYYAGHGIEMNGENYILPVGETIQNELDVRYASVNVDRLIDGMAKAGNGLNIVILDACRNNPYASSVRGRTLGLQRMKPSKGIIILYAAEPGKLAQDGFGRNGIFTQHLLESMDEPGLAVEQVFKKTAQAVNKNTQGRQTPWFEGVILGDFYFTPHNMQAISNETKEQLAFVEWQRIKYDDRASTFEKYIDKHKTGAYVDLAKQTLLILDNNGDTRNASHSTITKIKLLYAPGKYSLATLYDAKKTIQVNTRAATVSISIDSTVNRNNVVNQTYASAQCKQQRMDQILLGYLEEKSKTLHLSFTVCNQVSMIKRIYSVENRSNEKYPYEISIQRSVRDFVQMVTARNKEKNKKQKTPIFRPVW